MTGTRCAQGIMKVYSRPSVPLLDFLIPAFPTATISRSFASTSKCASRIGSAPLSLPAEVNLRILEAPKQKKLISRVEPPRILEIEGPLGGWSAEKVNGEIFLMHI